MLKNKLLVGVIVILAILLVLALVFPGAIEGILIGAGGLFSALFLNKNKIRKQSEEIEKEKENIKQRQKDSGEKVSKINKDRKERKDKADKHSEDMKAKDKKFKDTFFSILLIFFLVLSPVMANAEDGEPPPMTAENLAIPDNYEDLLEKYYEMFEWGMSWRQDAYTWQERYYAEYDDGEKLNLEIDYLNKELDNTTKLIETQQKMIEELLNQSGFGLSAGVNYVPLNPINSGVTFSIRKDF